MVTDCMVRSSNDAENYVIRTSSTFFFLSSEFHLNYAARKGQIAIVEQLLLVGADIEFENMVIDYSGLDRALELSKSIYYR